MIKYSEINKLEPEFIPFATQFKITDDVAEYIKKGMLDEKKLKTELFIRGNSIIIAKPVYIKVTTEGLIIKTPTVKFTIPYNAVNAQTGKTLETELIECGYEPEKLFGDFVVYELKKFDIPTKFGIRTDIRCYRYKIISKKTDVDTAKKLIEKHNPIGAILKIFGYLDNWKLKRLFFVRMFSVITNNHTIQLTGMNTGKTFFAHRLSTALNYGYFTSSVSPARLIYNGALRQEGEVFIRNGIIIDEILSISQLKDMEECLLSGLENGIWVRGISGAEHLSDRQRKIPFIMFGNMPSNTLVDSNNRELVYNILKNLGFRNAQALLDRFSIVDIFTEPVNAGGLLDVGFYPNSVLRGYVELLKKQYFENRCKYNDIVFTDDLVLSNIKQSANRLNRYYNDLRCFTDVLQLDIPDKIIKNVILGYTKDFDVWFEKQFGEDDNKTEYKKQDKINENELAEKVIEAINTWKGSASLNLIMDSLKEFGIETDEETVKKIIDELIKADVLTVKSLAGLPVYCLK